MFGAVLATVLFSLSVVFAHRSTQLLGGATANLHRLVLSTLFLGIWAHLFGQGLAGPGVAIFFISGCLGFGLGDLALYAALPRLGSRLTILLVHCLAAPFAVLVEWIWLGTTLRLSQLISAAIILGGVSLALAPHQGDPPRQVEPKQRWIGAGFGVMAALGQGMGAVLSRKAYAVIAAAGEQIDGGTAAYQRILGGLLVAGAATIWLQRGSLPPLASAWRKAWVWIVLNSLAGPTLGVSAYQWALETTPSGVVLPIVATTPLVVIPFAYWMEGDRPGVRSVAGGLIAVSGAIALIMVTR